MKIVKSKRNDRESAKSIKNWSISLVLSRLSAGPKVFHSFWVYFSKKRFLSWPSSSSGSTKTPRFLAVLRKSWRRLIIEKESLQKKINLYRRKSTSTLKTSIESTYTNYLNHDLYQSPNLELGDTTPQNPLLD